jgi:ABC-type antimicrobial peptide transport system permease subunit
MIVPEAALLGIAGAGAGVLAGLAVGAAAGLIGRPAGLPPLAIPWLEAALAFVLGVSVAILAAAYPARLAGRLPVVRAAPVD